jgi:hypothetical protein
MISIKTTKDFSKEIITLCNYEGGREGEAIRSLKLAKTLFSERLKDIYHPHPYPQKPYP